MELTRLQELYARCDPYEVLPFDDVDRYVDVDDDDVDPGERGGYPRELVTLLREALEEDAFPLSDTAFRRLLANHADEYKRKIPSTEALALLAGIRHERGPLIGPDDRRDLMEELLTRSLVFVYQNDEEWSDINPALASLFDAEHG